MATASLQLFADSVLTVEGARVALTPRASVPDGALVFEVAAADAQALVERVGRVGIAQTRRGIVLTRLRIDAVDLQSNTVTAMISGRARPRAR